MKERAVDRELISREAHIFASHNANFVVNGDAESVICCDYVKAGDQTGDRLRQWARLTASTLKTKSRP